MAGSGQISQYGGQLTLNKLCGKDTPIIGGTEAAASAAWVPGLVWVDTSSGVVAKGSSTGVVGTWAASTGNRYLALLTISPASAITVADVAACELTTAGYARAAVTFTAASAAYPSVTFNNGLVTWGPFSADMAQAVRWIALVSSSSGTGGSFLYWWTLPEAVQAPASQPIQIPTGGLIPGSGLTLDQA